MVAMLGHHGCCRLLPLVLFVASTGSIFAQGVENVRKRALQGSDVGQHGSINSVKKSEDETYWERYLQVADSLVTAAPLPAPTRAPVAPVPLPTTAPVRVPTNAPVVPTIAPLPAPTVAPVAPVPLPTSVPVSVPTVAPVAPTTTAPLAAPSVAPAAPVPLPTSVPVSVPTVAPVAPTTTAPLPAPTVAPVPTTTLAPVSLPTLAPVMASTCPVNVDLTCVYGPNSLPCDALITNPNATNCTVEVLLEINSCNFGTVDVAPSTLTLDINGTGPSGVDVQFLPGEPAGILSPNECYKAAAKSAFEVCIVSQYLMVATVGVNTATGTPLCEAQDTLSISISPAGSPVTAPTMMPVAPVVTPTSVSTPTLSPVAPPSVMPVPATMMPVAPVVTPTPVSTPTLPPVAPPSIMPVPATMMPVAPVGASTFAPVAPTAPGVCPLNVAVICVYGPNNLPCETLTTTPNATNCFVDVIMQINSCNTGLEDIAPTSISLNVNGTTPNGVSVEFLPGEPASILSQSECYLASAKSAFDVCMPYQYLIVATVGASTTGGVPICQAQDTLSVSITPGAAPVPAPTMPVPTMMPVAPILPPPSATSSPVAAPVTQPSAPIGQTIPPAQQGTGCIDVVLGCVYGANRAECDTIVAQDTENCILNVTYEALTCNIGTNRLVLDTLNFNIDGTGPTEVNGEIQPNPVMSLNPSECYTTDIIAGLNVCVTAEYIATVTVGFRPTNGGATCTAQDSLTLAWQA